MGQKYKVEDLLRLRASPLVCKPEGLPPAEEWMGALPDPTQRARPTMTRAKTEESSNQHDSNRRSGVFETRHISRTSSTVPEDLVLGPPKTSFASARTFNKQSDAGDKRAKSTPETEEQRSDRLNFRDKPFKDKEPGERDTQRRDGRLNALNGRRGEKEEREDWSTRQRRGFGQDDTDRRPKRNGEKDREYGSYDNKEKAENGGDAQRRGADRDGNRYDSRRVGAGRGRHELSWLKDESHQDMGDIIDEKSSTRFRDWRKDRAEAPQGDRSWNRGLKPEQDPEWMDSADPEDTKQGPKQGRTQEDFQRWKERMKASATPSGESPDTREEAKGPEAEKITSLESHETTTKEEHTMSATSMDKFFGLWTTSAGLSEARQPEAGEEKKDPVSAKPAKAKTSRFQSLFSPPTIEPSAKEVEAQLPLNPTPPALKQASSNDDQDDFQLLLQKMLGKSAGPSSQPVTSSTPPSLFEYRMPPPQNEPSRESIGVKSPMRDTVSRQEPPPYRDSPPRSRNSGGLDSLLGPKSPREHPSSHQNRDSDLLLRLMQQAQRPVPVVTQPQPPPQSSAVHTPGILQMPDLMSRPQLISKPKPAPVPASFFDDPAIANISRQESNEHRDQPRRRPTNGPNQSLYDEPPFLPGQQGHPPSNLPRPQQHQPLPYGMPRPPGFEQIPPPPWANPNHPVPPQHQQHQGPHIAPPPGIPNPPRTNNPFSSGPPLPFPGPMPQGHDNRPSNFPPRNPNQPGFGPPPGMPPPPGYMPGMNGPPPPGFPPLPNAHEGGMMGLPGGGPFGGNTNAGAGGPGLPRHLLEMFSQEGRGGIQGPFR